MLKKFFFDSLQLLMGIEDYSTQKIANASELQLQNMLAKFKAEEVSVSKLGGFLAYNFLALSGLLGFTSWYVKSHWVKKGEKGRLNNKQLTLVNVIKKGSLIGALIGGLYMAGFLVVGYYTMSIPVFKKYCQLQESLHSFQVKYDPFYQEILLFRKMKKFGLSDHLIQEVKQDLNNKKNQLIQNSKLKKQTIQAIKKAEVIHRQTWKTLIH